MKAKLDETMSSVEVEYKEVPFRDEYKIDVIEFEADVSITTGFEIDCQITIEVAVESNNGVVILQGQEWFNNLAESSGNRNLIRIDDLKVKESRVSDASLEQFLADGYDLVVEIKFSA